MSSLQVGVLAVHVLVGFAGYFWIGLKSEVGGHFPVGRAILASILAAGLGFGAAWLLKSNIVAARLAGPVIFVSLIPLFYRPRLGVAAAVTAGVTGVHWGLSKLLIYLPL